MTQLGVTWKKPTTDTAHPSPQASEESLLCDLIPPDPQGIPSTKGLSKEPTAAF